MNSTVIKLLGDAQKRMNGYTALMSFRFVNLCTKADPLALLPVTATIDGADYDLEALAQVCTPAEDQFLVTPNDQDHIFAICKGIAKAHPEFKIEKEAEPKGDNDGGNGKKDEDEPDAEGSDEEQKQLIRCTVPEVNKDRHDLIMEGVGLLADETKGKIDKIFTTCTAKIVKAMAGQSPEKLDEAKKLLKENYDWHTDMCKKYCELKKKEVEDAYQRYLKQKTEEETEKKEEERSKGENTRFSMKFNKEEE
ncbi:MAG: ribosome recycling factor [Prevotella sp.]|jgi:ribosome recycling factor|nr:ribosome recycling factor [Prevotella sp.]